MFRANMARRSAVLISVIAVSLFGLSSVAQADPGVDGDTLNGRTAAQLQAARAAVVEAAPAPAPTVFSVVVAGGDWFSVLVQKYCGRSDWQNIPFPGRDKDLIRVGETITIDCLGSAPVVNAPAPVNERMCGGDTWNSWNDEQRTHAGTIVHIGIDRGVPRRGLIVALMTAMQESTLHNYGYLGNRNDHDSQGLFQQRPSMGWGTVDQVTDPAYASNKFYDVLLNVRNWQNMEMTLAAQSVQVSAYPYAYAKWEHDATVMVDNC